MRAGRPVALGLAALLHLVPGPARAQDIAGLDDLELPPGGGPVEVTDLELESLLELRESLLELEVSAATKHPVGISDLPATASAVTRSQIRDYGWLSLNQILWTLPGFAPAQDFERRTAGFRGEREPWNNNRLLLIWDGMPHNAVETGSAYTSEATPLFFARRVDVVRGPASAIYGSNALHGVIAVDTVAAQDLGDGGVEARMRAGTGTQTLDAVGAQRGAWADAVVGVSAFQSEGNEYLDTDDSYRLDEGGEMARFRVQDEHAATYLWLKVEPTVASLEGLRLQVHRQTQEAETGHGWLWQVPDIDDDLTEQRTIVDLSYRKRVGKLDLEESLQYRRERYDATVRFLPAGAYDGFYPQGVTEVVDTVFHSLFTRSQVQRVFGPGVRLLGGVEYSGVLNRGDDAHYANVQLVDPTGENPPVDGFLDQGPVYEPIVDRPVHRIGAFLQSSSGQLLGERVQLTVGLRYDDLFFHFRDLDRADRPVVSDSYQQLSPRSGLVVRLAEPLRLKLMAGHSFRTPTVVELFSANTWAQDSNPHQLEPESENSYEAALDWAPVDWARLRTNGFLVDHRNTIDYEASETGLLRNLYSNRRAGAEAEILFERPIGPVEADGYASYGYVRLLDEEIVDPAIGESNMLAWSPSHMVKAGVRATTGPLGATLSTAWQSAVRRRTSDRMDETLREGRPARLPAFMTVDASLFGRPREGVKIGVEATNLLGSSAALVNPGDHSYDYPIAPREVLGVLALDL